MLLTINKRKVKLVYRERNVVKTLTGYLLKKNKKMVVLKVKIGNLFYFFQINKKIYNCKVVII